MGQTANYNIPYPDTDNPRNIPEDMKSMAESIDTDLNQIQENTEKSIDEKTKDTGWITATLSSDFKAYNNNTDNTPQYRKIGKMVEIRGVVSPKSAITGSTTESEIFTLPKGYIPTKSVYTICQGTGRNIWLLNVSSSGSVSFARYGTSSYADVSTSTWLPFHATFTID